MINPQSMQMAGECVLFLDFLKYLLLESRAKFVLEYHMEQMVEILKIALQDGIQALKVVGKIKTYTTFLDFKQELEYYIQAFHNNDKEGKYALQGDVFRIYFVRAHPLNSYVLGYLCKLHIYDKFPIEVIVDTFRMFAFFEDLDLVDVFSIKIKEEE
ncbi:hypothetical protein [Helicobacter equorum]|uniref:hypothetical protein n=1 Tax=Helicobacter equorum TaxID=361872 RepID=UPI001F1AE19C|nr:hypothetical protein [Helicobacter equorum]